MRHSDLVALVSDPSFCFAFGGVLMRESKPQSYTYEGEEKC